jgi:ribulose-phosphate 3-epimerase
MRIKIAPSILSADFARLAEEIQAVETAGADLIHVDVMDGRFVPPITIGAPVVAGLSGVADTPLDVHLMVHEPDHLLEAFAAAGAHYITVHVEAIRHLDRTLRRIRELGCKAGVALNPATQVDSVRWVLDLVDIVLIMSVNPGYGGQSFIPYCLDKVAEMKSTIADTGLAIPVQVDGGVKVSNISSIAAAGADIFVAGSAVFNSDDYAATIEALRTEAEAGAAE